MTKTPDAFPAPSFPPASPLRHSEPLGHTAVRGLWGALKGRVPSHRGRVRSESPRRPCPREPGGGALVTGAGGWRSLLGAPWTPSVWTQEAGHSHSGERSSPQGSRPSPGPAGFSCRTEGKGVSRCPAAVGRGRAPRPGPHAGKVGLGVGPSPGCRRASCLPGVPRACAGDT